MFKLANETISRSMRVECTQNVRVILLVFIGCLAAGPLGLRSQIVVQNTD